MKTVSTGFQSIKYHEPQTWEAIPSHLKEIDSLKNFKDAIRPRLDESSVFVRFYVII